MAASVLQEMQSINQYSSSAYIYFGVKDPLQPKLKMTKMEDDQNYSKSVFK